MGRCVDGAPGVTKTWSGGGVGGREGEGEEGGRGLMHPNQSCSSL